MHGVLSLVIYRVGSAQRRVGKALVAGLVLLVALTACGVATTTEDAGSQGLTRVVKDIDDAEVTVPEHPQRVVTLSEPTLDAALALGVKPVGTVAGRGQARAPHYLGDLAEGIPLVGTIGNLDYEKISSLDPDLIVVDGTSVNNRPDILDILKKIAPLVFTGYAGGRWELNFDDVADALNLADQGAEFKRRFEEKVSDKRQALEGKYSEKTFSIVRWQGSGPSLILKELPAGEALDALGLRRPDPQNREGRGHSEPVSLESLSTIDADYMFFGTLGGASQANPHSEDDPGLDSARKALEAAEGVSGFKDLRAYRSGNIILVDGSLWTSTGGPLLMDGIVDDVAKALLAS